MSAFGAYPGIIKRRLRTTGQATTFLSTSKDKLEEKFHKIDIRQDRDLGLVTFNYDFVVNDKVTNSGLEHWQLTANRTRRAYAW
jgi:hypothetical protein